MQRRTKRRLQRMAALALAAIAGTVGAYLTPTPDAAELAKRGPHGSASSR
jgi:hypothetical protein